MPPHLASITFKKQFHLVDKSVPVISLTRFCRHENLSSNPWHPSHIKSWVWLPVLLIPALWGREGQIPRALRPVRKTGNPSLSGPQVTTQRCTRSPREGLCVIELWKDAGFQSGPLPHPLIPLPPHPLTPSFLHCLSLPE